MTPMSAISAPTWLEGFGEWAWPGRGPAAGSPQWAVEVAPAAWVPTLPLRIEAPAIRRPSSARARTLPRPLRLARLALLILVAGATFVLSGGLALTHGAAAATAPPPALPFASSLTHPFAAPRTAGAASRTAAFGVLAPSPPLPRVLTLSSDAAGSAIASITYPSAALGWHDHFLVYLPPGYRAGAARRYPVLYLLHGDNEPASSFLRLGLQSTLDRLIATHAIAPLIAVMLQGAGLPNNWQNSAGVRGRQFNDYIGEVRRLSDRVLATIPDRASRGIAGYSMGGFGAMNVALAQLRSYSVVESWEGFFNNLSGELAADRPLLAHLPLHVFVYGGSSDTVAGSAQNAPWAAALRSAGADARSAIYPGGHTFTPIAAHLRQMLLFAGRALAH